MELDEFLRSGGRGTRLRPGLLVFLAFLVFLIVVFLFFSPSCSLSYALNTKGYSRFAVPAILTFLGFLGFLTVVFNFLPRYCYESYMCKIYSSPINTVAIPFTIEVVVNLLFVVRESMGYGSEWGFSLVPSAQGA